MPKDNTHNPHEPYNRKTFTKAPRSRVPRPEFTADGEPVAVTAEDVFEAACSAYRIPPPKPRQATILPKLPTMAGNSAQGAVKSGDRDNHLAPRRWFCAPEHRDQGNDPTGLASADRHKSAAQVRDLQRITVEAAEKWAAQTEHVKQTLETCLGLQRHAKPSFRRTGVRLYLQCTKVFKDLIAELRLQHERESAGPVADAGLTVEVAIALLGADSGGNATESPLSDLGQSAVEAAAEAFEALPTPDAPEQTPSV